MVKYDNAEDRAAAEEAIRILPNGIALSWGFIKQPKRGPKGDLSIDKIVSAAVSIADKDGLAAVSMNRVAQSLGFSAMSLYRYITSKEDLLFLMQDAVCAIALPSEEQGLDWRERLRTFVGICARIYRVHPWFGDIPISGVPVTPNNLRIVDWALRTMRDFPITDSEKIGCILLLSSYARASGMLQRDIERATDPEAFGGRAYTEALKRLVRAEDYPALYPVVQSGVYTGEEAEPVDDDIDFGLERILDGIAVYLDTKRPGTAPQEDPD